MLPLGSREGGARRGCKQEEKGKGNAFKENKRDRERVVGRHGEGDGGGGSKMERRKKKRERSKG